MSEFEQLRDRAEKAICRQQLFAACRLLHRIGWLAGRADTVDELRKLEEHYGMMLSYLERGGIDPERDAVHTTLLRRAFSLLDKLARDYALQNNLGPFALVSRTEVDESRRQNDSDRLMRLADGLRTKWNDEGSLSNEDYNAYFSCFDRLFALIITSPLWNADEKKNMEEFINRQRTGEQALLLGAMMTALRAWFDPAKIRVALSLTQNTNIGVKVRAVSTVALAYMWHKDRFVCYKELAEEIADWLSDTDSKPILMQLWRSLCLSMETKKAERKLKDDILPEIVKQHGASQGRINREQLEEELNRALNDEPNDAWINKENESRLTEQVRKLMEMGREGVDINWSTFGKVSNNAFFNNISHRLAPFDPHRPEVASLSKADEAERIASILSMGGLCEADKYSFILMLEHVPPAQRRIMNEGFGMDREEMSEMFKVSNDETSVANRTTNCFVQDLYRMFHVGPAASALGNPFEEDFMLSHYDLLWNIVNNEKTLNGMASFLMKHKCYKDAAALLDSLLHSKPADGELLQKIAFCHQKTGEINKAVFYYQQADLMDEDNVWIVRQMRLCYSIMGRNNEELRCLERLERLEPDDISTAEAMGFCLMRLERYEEAVRRFYEWEYRGGNHKKALRAIAWCRFMNGQMEHAEEVYQKLLNESDGNKSWEDCLNAGHVAWCKGEIGRAATLYKEFVGIRMEKKSGDDVLHPFDDDRSTMIQHGIAEADYVLMHDVLEAEAERRGKK